MEWWDPRTPCPWDGSYTVSIYSSNGNYSSTNDPGIPLTISGELGKILCGLDRWDSAPT